MTKMVKRDFLISDCEIEEYNKAIKIGNYYFYTMDNRYLYKSTDSETILAFGDIIDSLDFSTSIEMILERLINLPTLQDKLQYIDNLAGRFMIVIFNDTKIIIVPDAVASIPIHYSKIHNLIASNPYIISKQCGYETDQKAINLLDMSKLVAFPNDMSPFKEIKTILPNHYLDFSARVAFRYKTEIKQMSYEEVILNTIKRTSNITKKLSTEYSLLLPLSGGKDSRVILSLLLNQVDFKSYTFKHKGMNETHPDLVIPKLLSSKFSFPHVVLEDVDLSGEEITAIKSKMGLYYNESSVINGKTLRENKFVNEIFLDGNVIPLTKAKYGKNLPEFFGGAAFINTKTYNYSVTNKKQIRYWYKSAKKYSKETKISIFDLAFWEARTARWGEISRTNYDFFVDSINPFNCRAMILEWLSINRKKRYKERFHEKLISIQMPELLETPFDKKKNILIDNSLLYYFSSIIHYFVQKIKFKLKVRRI